MPEVRTVELRNIAWAVVALLGISQFIVVLFYAGYSYPETYRWNKHYISDLGRTVTAKGLDNTVNSHLFATSSFVLGLSILPFLFVYPSLFQRGRSFLRALAAMTAFGLIGIGQTPYNDYFILHHVCLFFWVIPMTILAIALPIFVLQEGYSALMLFVLSAILFFAAIGYAAIGSHSGYVIMQKIVVLISLGWFLILAYSVAVVSKWIPSKRQRVIEAQAEWYDRKLRKSRW